jgi:1,4-dihydroxy-2-naphthoate octaprenyltransferase
MAAGLGLRSLEQVPASKEVFVGLAWGTLAVLVPALSSGRGAAVWRCAAPAFVVCFLMAFQRTLKLDLRDVAADQLVGRETLAGLLGGRAATWLVFVLVGLEGAVLTAATLAGWMGPAGLLLLASIPYGVVCFILLRRRTGMEEDLAETLVTARFYLAGLLALSWHVSAG